jgi:cell division protein FtsI/penicillin-binding protein 2
MKKSPTKKKFFVEINIFFVEINIFFAVLFLTIRRLLLINHLQKTKNRPFRI